MPDATLPTPSVIRRADYQPPAFQITHIDLTMELAEENRSFV